MTAAVQFEPASPDVARVTSERTVCSDWHDVVSLPLDTLHTGPSPRKRRLYHHHVAVLAETFDQWPPILVRTDNRVIVDGHHRVEAARRLGQQVIAAVMFDGSDDDAYLEAVRQNISHGLALSATERKTAALGILRRQADWSDRRISRICGLSPSTVANLRRRISEAACGSASPPASRVGADGRRRPVDRTALRAHIEELVSSDPSASLRSVARVTGASPETVRTVRASLGAPPQQQQRAIAGNVEISSPTEVPNAFSSTEAGRAFVDWLTKTRIVPDDPRRYGGEIPLNRIYEVADEARRRARYWTELADLLEGRAVSSR